MVLNNRSSRALTAIAGIGVLALALSACSSTATEDVKDTTASEEGVAFGASKDDWKAAFADVDSIELRTQSSSAKGAASGKDFEDFVAEIEEWSDGKITFDLGYSSAYASPLEGIDALNDGRLDIAHVIPQYFAEELPLAASLVNMNVISNASPIYGAVSSNVWPLQAGFESEELMAESEELGMVPLAPYWNTGAGALICSAERNNLKELKGAVVAASGALQQEQVSAVGSSPTSMPFTEFYEALQRGAADCVQTTGTSALAVSIPEVAPHVVIDPEASFIAGASMLNFSKATWDALPLVAQQLIWDRTSTFVAGNITKVIGNYQLLNDAVTASGGSIEEFDADAVTAMNDTKPAILSTVAETAGEDFVSNAETLQSDWLQKTADAGFDVDVKYADIQIWLDDNQDSLNEFIQADVAEAVYKPYRP
ncbi:TRAP-type C4-dicarboxylate transport system substrate-binding protein [Leucobacter exalbidus]|uniref:TRAP-type C4-dicarboxylate transport system substrate-binding protein n=1 Tax=Leucobacter exalbidus TaxID=662960 RepID=A0A940PXR8_9MICO|nr:TRAP transporter substrate-binding protein DctP [Leucobacter exalbidus]MBP1327309.1 TRAP-type C4-dicarboxylate transport system substrate-binding protein [Leucobacter exalbidus]